MRILHVVQSLDPAWGGIARVAPELCAELTKAGHLSRVATLTGGRFGSSPPGCEAEVLAFDTGARANRLGRSQAFDAAIDGLVRDVDVVHLHGLWTGQNWSAGRAARRLGRPYLMTPHSMMMPWAWKRSGWKKRPIGWLFEHRNLRRAACVHALAEGEARHIRELGFNPRVEVVPNGLRTKEYESLPPPDGLHERFPQTREGRWLLFLGRIHPQKGIIQGLQACFDVLASGADWRLVIAGPDEIGLKRMIEAAVARKGVGQRVTFTGQLSREETRAALGRASVLLQPSLSEGLSMSILEALAAGLPVLISHACNMPEVETAGAGRVVDPSRRAIAIALRQMVAMSEEQTREMRAMARRLAQECYDWGSVIPQYVKLYENVLRGSSAV